MSGKGAGKKRNRAAQSEQHGYQGRPGDAAAKRGGKTRNAPLEDTSERERIMEKLRELDERRREEE
ncbi:MAG: hypothetical protein ACYC6Z_10710 [Thermoleophilia bacterium]